jgi:hypothetical protein
MVSLSLLGCFRDTQYNLLVVQNNASHKTSIYLMRASAVEADRAYNPEVVGLNPTFATEWILGTPTGEVHFCF